MGVFDSAFNGWNVKKENNRIMGVQDGFYFSAVFIQQNAEVVISINYNSGAEDLKSMINQVFLNMKNSVKQLKTIQVNDFNIVIHQQSQAVKKMAALTESIVAQFTQFLKLKACGSGCVCGKQGENLSFYEVNEGLFCLCDSCAGEIQAKMESNRKAIAAQRSKFVPGLVGAIAGTLIGGAIWVLIYNLGYIVGLVGALIVFLAMKGWEKLGGCLDVKGVVISFAISLVALFFANQIGFVMVLRKALNDVGFDYTFGEVWGDANYWLKFLELKGEYVKNLVFAYAFTIICGISFVINAIKSAKGSYTMKKIG